MEDEASSGGAWIERLKAGDPEAAPMIWERYYERLLRLVLRKFRGARRTAGNG